MIDTLLLFEELSKSLNPTAARKIAEVIGRTYKDLTNMVTKVEFKELTDAVKELAEAQKRTEERVDRLENTVKELIEAQKETEHRVKELAEAQKRTEEEIKKLTKGLRETRQMVGNLTDTVGYTLEDRAINLLPDLLKREYKIEIMDGLMRKYVRYPDEKGDELNIFGVGKKDGKKLFIIEESKSRLSKKHIDRFLKLISRLEKYKIIEGEKFLLVVTYTTTPEVEEYAKSKDVNVIWSYKIWPQGSVI